MASFCDWAKNSQVVWREYLPPVIRWRYEGKQWQEIEGDNYQTSTSVGVCPADYQAFGTFINLNINQGGCREIVYWRTKEATNGAEVESWQPAFISPFYVGCPTKNNSYVSIQKISKAQFDSRYMPNLSGVQIFHGKESDNCVRAGSQSLGYDFKLIDVKRVDGFPDDCGDCTLTITKTGEIIYEETSDTCPEVEKLPCRLSNVYRSIEINKQLNIEAIEINQDSIPSSCLNIYLKSSTNSEFVAQICSSPNCPPPEYEVICEKNDCEPCPPNTCAIKCGSKVCCYGADGMAVKSIDLNRYCA